MPAKHTSSQFNYFRDTRASKGYPYHPPRLDSSSKPKIMENLKSISIFTSYFLAIFVCAAIVIRSILTPFSRNGTTKIKNALIKPTALFTFLALISLSLTWYHMLCFFRLSYLTWARTIASPGTPHTIGYWLRDTKLFEEAYRIVVTTPERWWWSQQIFLACFGWGVWVSYQGHGGVVARGGKGRSKTVLTAYMVLAQLVSLSVAVNLYFVDVLTWRGTELASIAEENKGKKESQPAPKSITSKPPQRESIYAKILLGIYLTLCFLPTSVLPTLTHTPKTSPLNKLFFPALLLPHVALFIPIYFTYPVSPRFTRILYTCSTFGSVACHAASSLAVLKRVTVFVQNGKVFTQGTDGIAVLSIWDVLTATLGWLSETLFTTHPAVSSVSWDVICFCASVAVWAGVEGGAEDGVWVGGVGSRSQGREKVGWVSRVVRILVAGTMLTVGGAGVGALVFAGDL